MPPIPPNDWSEYKRKVLAQLKRDEADIKELFESQEQLRLDVVTFQTKVKTWAAVGAAIGTVLLTLGPKFVDWLFSERASPPSHEYYDPRPRQYALPPNTYQSDRPQLPQTHEGP